MHTVSLFASQLSDLSFGSIVIIVGSVAILIIGTEVFLSIRRERKNRKK